MFESKQIFLNQYSFKALIEIIYKKALKVKTENKVLKDKIKEVARAKAQRRQQQKWLDKENQLI